MDLDHMNHMDMIWIKWTSIQAIPALWRYRYLLVTHCVCEVFLLLLGPEDQHVWQQGAGWEIQFSMAGSGLTYWRLSAIGYQAITVTITIGFQLYFAKTVFEDCCWVKPSVKCPLVFSTHVTKPSYFHTCCLSQPCQALQTKFREHLSSALDPEFPQEDMRPIPSFPSPFDSDEETLTLSQAVKDSCGVVWCNRGFETQH